MIAKLLEEATLSGSTEFTEAVTEYFTQPSSELDTSDESDSDHHEEEFFDDGKCHVRDLDLDLVSLSVFLHW